MNDEKSSDEESYDEERDSCIYGNKTTQLSSKDFFV